MPRPRASERDREIAHRLRSILADRGVIYADLAGALGVTFQQVGKAVRGDNRMSAGQLAKTCEFLGMSADRLLFNGGAVPTPRGMARELDELADAYRSIECPKQRASLRRMARALANGEES